MADEELRRALEIALRDALRALRTYRFQWGGKQRKFSLRERRFIEGVFLRLWLARQALHPRGMVIEAGTDDLKAAYGRRGFNLTDAERDNAVSHLRAALREHDYVVETQLHRVYFHEEEREPDDRGYYEFGVIGVERRRGDTWEEIYRKDDPDWVRLGDIIAPSPLHQFAAQFKSYAAFEAKLHTIWNEVHDRTSAPARRTFVIVVGVLMVGFSLELAAAIDPRVPALSHLVRRIVGREEPESRRPQRSSKRTSPAAAPHPPATTTVALANADVQALFVAESHVYIAAEASGLFVVEVGNHTRVLSHVPIMPAHDVVVSRGAAYVATGGGGVVMVDVRDPNAPRLLPATLPTLRTTRNGIPSQGSSNAVFVHDSLLLIAQVNGFSVYDISDPLVPRHLGDYVEQQDAIVMDVIAYGTNAITAAVPRASSGGLMLQSFDISTPHAPKLRASLGSASGVPAFAVHDHFAIVPRDDGLWILDIKSGIPDTVADFSGPAIGAPVTAVTVSGDEAFATTLAGGVIVDLSDLPRLRVSERVPDVTGPMARIGSHLCAVVGPRGSQQLRCDRR
ncbi:MAG TPA: hypothetical protein VEO54_15175 [Thermoanaerobaculia bacterium]|nr:hypothetical protein [Thermoanaerobaculia bacterium]